MQNIREVTIDLPLDALSRSGFPSAIVRGHVVRFLRQDTWGFQIRCEVSPAAVPAFKRRLAEHHRTVRAVEMERDRELGPQPLLLRGRWSEGDREHRSRMAKMVRSLARCQPDMVHPPRFLGGTVRIALRGESSRIEKALGRFEALGWRYRVVARAP